MTEKMLNTFVTDYINFINTDIFKASMYYEVNNNQKPIDGINHIVNSITKNISCYFSQIKNLNEANNILRLGDMHGENKCTVLIEYPSEKIIYKPFGSHFLHLINQILHLYNLSGQFDFYCLKLLWEDKNGSYIEYLNNEKPKDIDRFSYHYGALILTISLLRGTDFHIENIFCNSSMPIIVDYETFFYPIISEFKEYCVEATSLIKTHNNKHTIMNRYNLNIEKILKGINFAATIVRENINQMTYLIRKYSKMMARVIFKPTSFYLDILKKSTHPSILSCRKSRATYLEKCLSGKSSISSAIMMHEIEDLLTFNIPIFYFKNNGLYNSLGKKIKQNLVFSSVNSVYNDLKQIDCFKNRIIKSIGLS